MPQPTFWNNETALGGVSGPLQLIALWNGQFASGWYVDDVSVQNYTGAGATIGSPVQANTTTAGQQGWDRGQAMASLVNGNFVVVWNDPIFDASGDLRARLFLGNGTAFGSEILIAENVSLYGDVSITGLNNGGGFIAVWDQYHATDPNSTHARIFNASGVAIGPSFQVAANADVPTVAELSNGNIVIGYRGDDGGGAEFRIFDSTGALIPSSEVVVATIGDPFVSGFEDLAGLQGGGFVATWISIDSVAETVSVIAQVFNNAGAAVSGQIIVGDETGGNDASVIGLQDGGFLVVWDEGTGASATIHGARYTASGVADGGVFTIGTTTNETLVHAALAPDGRVIVAWGNSSGGAEYRILDPRETGITLSGGGIGEEFYGSAYSDIINGNGGDDILFGAGGDDTLRGGSGTDSVNGGDGNDTLIFTTAMTGAETIIGGDGVDTVSWQYTNSNFQPLYLSMAALSGIERIQFTSLPNIAAISILDSQIGAGLSATAEIVGGGTVDWFMIDVADGVFTMPAFQFTNWSSNDVILITGTFNANNTITGSAYADNIDASGGVDVLSGAGGDDRLSGGANNDTLNGDEGDDILEGEAGEDVLNGGAGDDLLMHDDGNDTLNGGDGIDTLFGGGFAHNATWVRNPNGTWTVSDTSGTDTLTDVEFIAFSDRTVHLDDAAQSFSGDGTSDILFRSTGGGVVSWNVAGAAIASASYLGSASTSEWTFLGTGDFTGDGRADVIWQHSSSLVYGWEMNGGVIAEGIAFSGVGAEWSFIGTGDFNGDHVDDFAWRHVSGVVFTWENAAGGTLQSAGYVTGLGLDWSLAGLGDFTGDGRDDFLWRNDSGQTYVWEMNGRTIVSSQALSAQAGNDWTIQGIGDFNRDGRDDILWQHDSGLLASWQMDGETLLSATYYGGIDTDAFSVSGVGDYNGDGRDDILFRNTDNGVVYVWLMGDGAIASAGAISGVGLEWDILGD